MSTDDKSALVRLIETIPSLEPIQQKLVIGGLCYKIDKVLAATIRLGLEEEVEKILWPVVGPHIIPVVEIGRDHIAPTNKIIVELLVDEANSESGKVWTDGVADWLNRALDEDNTVGKVGVAFYQTLNAAYTTGQTQEWGDLFHQALGLLLDFMSTAEIVAACGLDGYRYAVIVKWKTVPSGALKPGPHLEELPTCVSEDDWDAVHAASASASILLGAIPSRN